MIGFTFHQVCSGNHYHQTPSLLRVKTSVIQGEIVSHRFDSQHLVDDDPAYVDFNLFVGGHTLTLQEDSLQSI